MRHGSVLLFASLVLSGAEVAAQPPDLTGIWGVYRASGQGGGGTALPELPMRPEAARRVAEYRQLVAPLQDTPGGFCLGSGMPGSMLGSGGYPMEIVQHEALLLVIYEAHTEVRHIYLNDSADAADLFPDRNGYSTGQWQDNQLTVTTTHLKDALDQRQVPHGENAEITEVYSVALDDNGQRVLTARMTLTDPDFYTAPVTVEKRWAELSGARLLPYECNEPTWNAYIDALREAASGDEQ